MKIIIDTNILIYMMLENKIDGRLFDPINNNEIGDIPLRAKALREYIEQKGGVIIIPTPVLAEY
ncbi:VapC toxin family PIN domain ribonuclease, partial [Xenorhabdus bovienii]